MKKLFLLFALVLAFPLFLMAQTPESHVTMNVADTQKREFSVKFTPQSDVASYKVLAMEEGEMAKYKIMYQVEDYVLINGWGGEESGVQTVKWDEMTPATDYKVYVMGFNRAGEFYGVDSLSLKTLTMGGSGEARVAITLGKYIKNTWTVFNKDSDLVDSLMPSQFLTFTPNDQASCYRYGVYLKSQYDKIPVDTIKADIQQDPPYSNVMYWFWYEPLTTDFQINTSTAAVAVASAKNADGVWGPLEVFEFTTASETDTAIKEVEAGEQRESGDVIYNLAGQRMDAARKGGIYIQNGRKRIR